VWQSKTTSAMRIMEPLIAEGAEEAEVTEENK
jgi:hypothetical protein